MLLLRGIVAIDEAISASLCRIVGAVVPLTVAVGTLAPVNTLRGRVDNSLVSIGNFRSIFL